MKLKDLLYILVIAFLVLLGLHQCSQNADLSSINKHNAKAYQDSIKVFKDKLGREVYLKRNILLESTKQIDDLTKENKGLKESLKKFKRINSVTQIKTQTVIKEVLIPFTDTLRDTIVLYRNNRFPFEKEAEYFNLIGYVDLLGVYVQKLTIPNEQTVIVGNYKQSFFKPSTLSTTITNSNPLIKVQDVKTYQVIVPKAWYEKAYITIPLSLISGMILWEVAR